MEMEEKLEELRKLYNEAVNTEEFKTIVEKRKDIEREINNLSENPDLWGEVLLPGYWAEYYYWKGKEIDEEEEEEIKGFIHRVRWFWKSCKEEVAFGYGDLLSTAYDYILDDKEKASEVFKEMKKRAEKSGNRVALLRVINRIVTSAMRHKEWGKAVEEASKAEKLLPVQDKVELRHFGNIFNNRGASKIRGDIDVVDGIRDLNMAMDFYFKEDEIPVKHIIGIIRRFHEAMDKLLKKND